MSGIDGTSSRKKVPVTLEWLETELVSAAGGLVGDVRWEKVAALKQQIAAGTYHVPAREVAEKVMESLFAWVQ